MKLGFPKIFAILQIFAIATQAQAQMTPEAAATLQRSIAAEREADVVSVPFTLQMGKLAIDAAVNGAERQFIFDTGSPTLISRELAKKLDLTIIGSNTGYDANGREVTTDIAIVDRLKIAAITFRSVPVLIADFSIADPDGCLFDGGVIGSEILPGHVWHIDATRQVLNIAANLDDLASDGISAHAISAPLYDFGYPHAPIFDYSIGELTDKGLFDTGNSDTITLFDRVARDPQVQGAMISGSVRKGRGSHGVSAAGQGATSDLLRFEIEGVQLSSQNLGQQIATTRNAAPSLIGLGILGTHSVTLDYPNALILLHPRAQPQPNPSHPGYALMTRDGEVRVTQLYNGSPAQRAGLTLGDSVVGIDGRELSHKDNACETMRWLVEMRVAKSARRLTVLRDGQRVEVDLGTE